MQTIEVRVLINSSQILTRIVFPFSDLKIIEGNRLYLKSDKRKFTISDEQVRQLIFQSELEIKPEPKVEPKPLVNITEKINELKK